MSLRRRIDDLCPLGKYYVDFNDYLKNGNIISKLHKKTQPDAFSKVSRQSRNRRSFTLTL